MLTRSNADLHTGAPSALDRIGRMRKAKIEVLDRLNLLRVTAAKSAAEFVADDIERLLTSTERARFLLDPWLGFLPKKDRPKDLKQLVDFFPKQSFRQVESLTGTAVQPVSYNLV